MMPSQKHYLDKVNYILILDWDSDMATLLLLLHLLPPSPGKKVSKISASDAINRLVVYQKVMRLRM